MEKKIVLVDTSILIDFFRKTDKRNSVLMSFVKNDFELCISSITGYEIYIGANENQIEYWDQLLKKIIVIAFDKKASREAVEINNLLKKNRKQIDIADLFIAATAIANDLPIITLNEKHFNRIDKLKIIN